MINECWKSMIDVEYDVNGLESLLRDRYGLEDGWYGDCYPSDIRRYINELASCKDKESYEEVMGELEEVFEDFAKQKKKEEKESYENVFRKNC